MKFRSQPPRDRKGHCNAVQAENEIMQVRPFEFALGRAAMNFGALEYSLLCGIAELAPLVSGINLDTRVETTFRAALNRYDGFVRTLTKRPRLLSYHSKVMDDLRKLGNRRNELIHGAWFDAPGTDINRHKAKVRRHATLKALIAGDHAADLITPLEILNWANEVYVQRRAFDDHRETVLHYANDAHRVIAKPGSDQWRHPKDVVRAGSVLVRYASFGRKGVLYTDKTQKQQRSH